MNLLWLTFFIHSVYTRSIRTSGDSEPVNNSSDLCKPWSCLYSRLGSLDSEVPRHHFRYMFKGLLPQGAAQDVVDYVINSCFDKRYEAYEKPGFVACPLQTHLLCILDQFIEHCPQENLNTTDACTPVRTEVGTKFMYSQGVYRNIEQNPGDGHLKTNFSSKCCFVPEIINRYIMSDCGFTSLLEYQEYVPQSTTTGLDEEQTTEAPITVNETTSSSDYDALKIVSLKDIDDKTTAAESTNRTTHNILEKAWVLASTYLQHG